MFKPMLAAAFKGLHTFKPPYLISNKLDGVRCIMVEGVAYSRALLPFPNHQLQEKARQLYAGSGVTKLDGELVCGDVFAKDVYQRTHSVTSSYTQPIDDLKFAVFDSFEKPDDPYTQRYAQATYLVEVANDDFVYMVEQRYADTMEYILEYEEEILDKGGEGLIVRSPDFKYKNGRSTLKENGVLKLKRFVDSEAIIVSSVALQHNNNTATLDVLGNTKRSTHASGKVSAEMLGAITVRDLCTAVQFEIGSGFTHEQRTNLWKLRDSLAGRIVKYKYFPIGAYAKPRHPVFLGFVSKMDMGE